MLLMLATVAAICCCHNMPCHAAVTYRRDMLRFNVLHTLPPHRSLRSQCDALAERAYTALESAKAVWQEALSPFHEKMVAMSAMLGGEGRPRNPAMELLVLLATGVAPSAVRDWVCVELKEAELLRTLKGLNLAANALLQLLVTTIHPALEMLIQRLSHLHGLSRWPYHFAALGLQPPRVTAALDAAASLRSSAEALLIALRTSQVACRDC